MYDLSLTVPDTQKSYFDEMVISDETKDLYKYSFSKNLDDMEVAIYARTGCNINLKNATWRLINNLNVKIRHLMNTHGVDYSMVTYSVDKKDYLDVYMRSGKKWLMAEYENFNETDYYDWHLLMAMKHVLKIRSEIDFKNEDDSEEGGN